MNQWILVADASRARVFSVDAKPANGKRGGDNSSGGKHGSDKRGGDSVSPWVLEKELEHPESRAKVTDLVTGQPGRTQQSGNPAQRSSMSERTDPKEVEAEVFARQLAEFLHQAHNHNRFERLVLVAPPHFLGLLRASIDAQVAKLICLSLDKDYTHPPVRDLMRHIDLNHEVDHP
jgi:protein required for attachment to host cells